MRTLTRLCRAGAADPSGPFVSAEEAEKLIGELESVKETHREALDELIEIYEKECRDCAGYTSSHPPECAPTCATAKKLAKMKAARKQENG